MRECTLLAITVAMLVSGCSKHAVGGKTEPEQDKTAMAPSVPGTPKESAPGAPVQAGPSGSQLNSGLWETTLTINSAKAINVTGDSGTGSLDEFGDIKLTPTTTKKLKTCLSSDEAAKVAPAMMSGTGLSSCRWEKLDTPPGAVSGTLTCGQPQNGEVMRVELTGAMLPNLIGTQLHVTIGDPAGAHVVSEATMQGERVGDCTAASPK